MRADRLVSILMLLQTRPQVTAAEVAAELEVSARTARRDLDALGMSGVPIYAVQGRGGGYRLAGGGRTDLSGLNANEALALFMVAGSSAPANPAVKQALRKLMRALPEPMRSPAQAASGALVIDREAWGRTRREMPTPPFLDAVQQAVVEGSQLRLGYVARTRESSERVVHPLGLAAKGSVWYLVADTEAGLRTFRVDRITSASNTGQPVARPAGFDLDAAWRMITDEVELRRTPTAARLLADSGLVPMLRGMMGSRVQIGPSVADGRVEVEVRGHSPRALAVELAGFGAALEVLEPAELRTHLATIGRELVERY